MNMIKQQKVYDFLICLILVSFGFFGSLSHIFSLALIILVISNYILSEQKNQIDFRSKVVYLAVSGCFFLFLISGVFHSNFNLLLQSLSQMLPLPLIGVLIIFHNEEHLYLSSKKLSQFSQLSILFSFGFYIFFIIFMDPISIYPDRHGGRLSLFYGNPIPFSFVMLGLSIFCLADWRNSANKNRLTALIFLSIGVYFSGILSGSRGTLLAIIIISPIIIFFLTNNIKVSILIICALILVGIFIIKANFHHLLENYYFGRLIKGAKTIIFLRNEDSSIFQRLEMWSASIKAFYHAPIFGYGVTERFNAIKPYLNNNTFEFTHPHNDTFAGFIANGFLGGLAVITSTITAFLAGIFAKKESREKKILGLAIAIVAFITANLSTIYFNDISCAWLAFSTYLIWITDFNKRQVLPTNTFQ